MVLAVLFLMANNLQNLEYLSTNTNMAFLPLDGLHGSKQSAWITCIGPVAWNGFQGATFLGCLLTTA